MQVPSNLSAIATIVRKDWKNIYYGAIPYLEVMATLDSIDDHFYDDSARSIVICFLANAHHWHGETAKAVKEKLNQLLKGNIR
ncbi:hypothetical protein ACDQ55_21240 [Chitinophaga sp. 30R24]|uniref:hypothetical protein n=1 Tax=Chitinophaga sp. 30R24 TaxID=3248838 RepID=UPI003B906D54